jgi:D-glycero-alpha-D-manno-heptose 1-phosphate guanylyltransferase
MPSVLLICGGFGTRLRGLHPNIPKPLIAVNGKPFIEWIVLAFMAQGFRNFIFAAGYLSEKIEAWCNGLSFKNCAFRVLKESQPLGTGGAILNALTFCDDEIIVTNGDSLLLFDFFDMIRCLRNHDMVIAGRLVSDCSRYGSLEVSRSNLLKSFIEKRPGSGLINGGIYFFKKALLDKFSIERQISMEAEIIPHLLELDMEIFVYDVGDAPFIDIGVPETLRLANNFLSLNESYWRVN